MVSEPNTIVESIDQSLLFSLLYLLYPFSISTKGISTKPLGQQVTFKFLNKPESIQLKRLKDFSLSINLVSQKESQINYLKEEVKYKRIEEQLASKQLSQKIEQFGTKLEQEVCSTDLFK